MPAELTVIVVIGSVFLIAWLITGALHRHGPADTSVDDDGTKCLAHDPHAAPARPYAVDEAHWITQEHIDCDAISCAAKGAAIRVLTEAGRMKPGRDVR
ncbi:hypothetical protein [Nocardia amamiensis]|uniref:hypothetical protein n=1 Tax=Nocardia amamiensis TaxID=404578 RepID=UPI0008326DDB|nr:hypothetical protein [Nocardia amamiensis]